MIRSLLMIFCLLAAPAFAVEPDEMLADPVMEKRAQALDEALRCVKCRSENIASSRADWARDARILVRELIEGGASDTEVIEFFKARYGDYVLMKPEASGANLLLWLAGPALLLVAGGIALSYLRGRSGAPSTGVTALSAEEQARLDELLKD